MYRSVYPEVLRFLRWMLWDEELARDLAQVRSLCEISAEAEALLASAEAPIVLLSRRANAPIAENVAPDNPNLGIMLPYTPLHHLLLRELAGSAQVLCVARANFLSRFNALRNSSASSRLAAGPPGRRAPLRPQDGPGRASIPPTCPAPKTAAGLSA